MILVASESAPVDLLNRWIVPLECGQDHWNMPSNRQLIVPFD